MSLFDVTEASNIITEAVDPDANIIFGAVIDENLEDEIRVTVIATGFGGKNPVTGAMPHVQAPGVGYHRPAPSASTVQRTISTPVESRPAAAPEPPRMDMPTRNSYTPSSAPGTGIIRHNMPDTDEIPPWLQNR